MIGQSGSEIVNGKGRIRVFRSESLGRQCGDRSGDPSNGTMTYFLFGDPRSVSGLNVGDRFMVCDLNAGDRFEVMRSAFRTIA